VAECAGLLPARIANEEPGDLLEDVDRRLDAGEGRIVYLRVIVGCGWALVNPMRDQPSKGGTGMEASKQQLTPPDSCSATCSSAD
jgi:hypothetical protein